MNLRSRNVWVLSSIVGIFAAVLLVGAASVYSANRPPPDYTSTYVPQPPPPRPARLAVIGDSYSAGAADSVAWPELLSERRGWYLHNISVDGTGYVAGREMAFPNRFGYLLSQRPDVVVVAGSRNDENSPPSQVEAAATALFTELKTKAPKAVVLVIGPIWDSSPPTGGARAANDATRRATESAGFTFVDALSANWLSDPALLQADRVHPTDAGQNVLTDRINEIAPDIAPVPQPRPDR